MDVPLKAQESPCLHLADIRCSEAGGREARLKGVEDAYRSTFALQLQDILIQVFYEINYQISIGVQEQIRQNVHRWVCLGDWRGYVQNGQLQDQCRINPSQGSGIGRDCAMAFASEGAKGVAFADINLTAATEAAEESKAHASNLDYQAIALQVDISNEESVQRMVTTTLKEFNRIDYSVNSAGVSRLRLFRLLVPAKFNLMRVILQLGIKNARPVSETCMAEFDNLMSVNVKGTMLCVRAVSGAMKAQEERLVAGRTGPFSVGRGSIVNLASANSVVAFPEIVQYTAAKHAVLGITKTAGTNSQEPKTVYFMLTNPSSRQCTSWYPCQCSLSIVGRNPDD